MPNVIYTATLDFTDNGVFNAGWRIKQGDFGSSSLNITLSDNGAIVFDDSIEPEIVFKRADGRSVISTMQSAGENSGYYIYNFVGNELAVPGPCVVDVKIVGSDSRTSTASCRFDVIEDTIGYDPTGAETYNNPVASLVDVALTKSEEAEAYAVGTRNGRPVGPEDPTYHNNSKYWSELRMGSKIKNITGRFYTTTGGLLDSCVIGFEAKQSGNGVPSPSNVRAISGHTQVDVKNCGKNLIEVISESVTTAGVTFTVNRDASGSLINITANGTSTGWVNYVLNSSIKFKAGTYTFSGAPALGTNAYISIREQDGTELIYTNNNNEVTLTLNEDKNLKVQIVLRERVTFNSATFYPMLRLFTDTDPTYVSYNGYTTTINLGGTYYGGTLDAVSGVFTVTHGFGTITDFTGKSGSTVNNVFYKNIADIKRISSLTTPNIYSDKYVATPYGTVTSTDNNSGIGVNEYGNVCIGFGLSSTIDTLEEANAWATANPIQIAYELATPQKIQLTPTQLETLVGQNNLSAPLEGQSFASAEYRDNISVVYITDERVVGKWIDGKDIYQRTIDLGSSGVSVPANSSASTGLAKGNVALPIWSTAISPSGQAFPYIGCSVGSTYIMMENKTGNATTVRYFTFQYTKS